MFLDKNRVECLTSRNSVETDKNMFYKIMHTDGDKSKSESSQDEKIAGKNSNEQAKKIFKYKKKLFLKSNPIFTANSYVSFSTKNKNLSSKKKSINPTTKAEVTISPYATKPTTDNMIKIEKTVDSSGKDNSKTLSANSKKIDNIKYFFNNQWPTKIDSRSPILQKSKILSHRNGVRSLDFQFNKTSKKY